MLALPPRRLVREGVPIVAILLFWNLLAVFVDPHGIGGAVRNAGVVMAVLYVVVRGAGLAPEAVPPSTEDIGAVLWENARLAVPAGAWFLAALVVYLLGTALGTAVRRQFHFVSEVVTSLEGAFAGAGLGVVGLYAVATGFAAFDGGASSTVPQADDRGVDS